MLYNKNFFTRINNVLFLFIYNFFFFNFSFFSFFTQHVNSWESDIICLVMDYFQFPQWTKQVSIR